MPKAVVFDDELEAKTAFELGPVNFKCNVCGRVHRSGSEASYDCLKKLQDRVASYGFRFSISDFGFLGRYDPWRYWGREKELVEYEALKGCIYEVFSNKALSSGTWKPKYYMLALPESYIEKVNERKLSGVYRDAEGIMNGPFKELFNRLLEVACLLEEAKSPNLPFPILADFKENKFSLGGESFVSFYSFFWPRLKDAAQSITNKELRESISNYTLSGAYDKLAFLKKSYEFSAGLTWASVKAGYFLQDGAYLITVHDGIQETKGDYYSNSFKSQTYCIFYLDGYERPRFLEAFFGDDLSAEDLFSRLIEKARAA